MDVKLIFEIIPGFVPGIAFQRPSAKTKFLSFFIFFLGVSMLFGLEQPISKAVMNMRGIIFFCIIIFPLTFGITRPAFCGRVNGFVGWFTITEVIRDPKFNTLLLLAWVAQFAVAEPYPR